MGWGFAEGIIRWKLDAMKATAEFEVALRAAKHAAGGESSGAEKKAARVSIYFSAWEFLVWLTVY